MGSLGTGELLVIAVVALIVFGPKRLPELARKAGEMLAKTREATKSVTSALDSEYDGITAPLQDLKKEYDSTVQGFKDVASTATGFSVDLTSTTPGKNKADDAASTDTPSSNGASDTPAQPTNPGTPDDDTGSEDTASQSEPEPES